MKKIAIVVSLILVVNMICFADVDGSNKSLSVQLEVGLKDMLAFTSEKIPDDADAIAENQAYTDKKNFPMQADGTISEEIYISYVTNSVSPYSLYLEYQDLKWNNHTIPLTVTVESVTDENSEDYSIDLSEQEVVKNGLRVWSEKLTITADEDEIKKAPATGEDEYYTATFTLVHNGE